jgi:hypothetical protein
VFSASTGARRFYALAGTLWAVALAVLCCPVGAEGANVGGTSPGSAPPTKTPSKPATTGTGAHVKTVRITSVTCTPSAHCSANPRQVATHGTVLVKGLGLKAGMVLGFPKSPGAGVNVRSPAARLRSTTAGMLATVPKAARSGRVKILLSHGRYTSSFGPLVVSKRPLHPPIAKPTSPVKVGAVGAGAFEGQGMWIWYVSKSSGGSIPAIIAQARASGVTTVFVKSSDGSANYWSQFSSSLVAALHAGGLKVCAWQYVYGSNPTAEAGLGAQAVANGADCLVIDAEAEYEGKYGAAQSYMQALRAKVGPSYPIGLSSFPYVSYHSSFPYSVFLGPGGAQFNLPQMYWKTIGVSVDTIYANTYIWNRPYQRAIFPLGQTYDGASSSELVRFREEAVDYGAAGWSFWDWQETSSTGWAALAAPMTPLTSVTPNTSYPELSKGSKGDPVLWLQEHLAAAVPTQETTGNFATQTTSNLRQFQAARGIPVTGTATAPTWAALLSLEPVPVDWTGK